MVKFEFPINSQGKSKGLLDFNRKFQENSGKHQLPKIQDLNYNSNGGRGLHKALKDKKEKEKIKLFNFKIKNDDITENEIEEQRLIYNDGPEKRGFKRINKGEAKSRVTKNNIKVNPGNVANLNQAGSVASGLDKFKYIEECKRYNNVPSTLSKYDEFIDLDPILENEYYSMAV